MNRRIVDELLVEHGKGKFMLSHRIDGTDFEVMVSLLQPSGNTFVQDYCARERVDAGVDGLSAAAARSFKAVHAAIEADLHAKPPGMSLPEFVADPAMRRLFFRPFD
jgi:hypothetical protein